MPLDDAVDEMVALREARERQETVEDRAWRDELAEQKADRGIEGREFGG